MKKPEIAHNLIEYLNSQIVTGRYPIGSKLPSLRSLARKFNVSYSSARNGIEYLEKKGKIHRSARRGIFVQSRNAQDAELNQDRQIALIAPHFTSLQVETAGLFHSVLGVVEQLALENNFSLLVIPLPNLKIMQPETVEKLNSSCQGVILMKELDGWMTEMPLRIPTVGILMENDYGGQLSIAGIDPHHAAREAAGFFLQRGIEQVHVVYQNYPCYKLRAELFELQFREMGGSICGRTLKQPEVSHDLGKAEPDCGYFFASDSTLQYWVEFQRHKYKIDPFDPEKMIAIDGKSLLMNWDIRFPTLALDWREIGEAAFFECLELIKNPDRRRRRLYLAGTLHLPTLNSN